MHIPQKTTLANGVRVVSVTMPESASASLRFMIKTGSAFETEDEQGLSHFAEHMFFQGTESRPSFGAIGRAIESIGGVLNGQTGRLITTYWVKMLPEHADTAFDVVSDLLLHPRLDPHDINRERQVVLQEINRRHDRPDEYVWSLLEKALWPKQAMGRETLGTAQTLASFDHDILARFIQKQYRSADLLVAAAGPMPHEQIVDLSEKYLGGMTSNRAKPKPKAKLQPGRDVRVEQRPTAQTQLCLGFPAFGHLDPRIHSCHVLTTLLGRGISSRLFLNIRERLGLAYSISAAVLDRIISGSMTISGGLHSDRLSEAIDAIIWELERIKNQPIEPEELSRAKELNKAGLLFGLERVEVVADHFGSQELLLGHMLPVEEELAQIEKTDIPVLHDLARSLFNFADMKAAAVGDFAQDVLERHLDEALGKAQN